MVQPDEVSPHLAARLEAGRDQVARRWLEAVRRSLHLPSANRLDDQQLLDHLPRLFEGLRAYLQNRDDPANRGGAGQTGREHGAERERQGYSLEELLRDLTLFEEAVLHEVVTGFVRERRLDWEQAEGVRLRVAHFFQEAVAASAARFAEQSQARLQEREAARLRLLRVVGHELANALNTAGAAAGALATRIETPELRQLLDICTRSLADLRTLLADLRDYTVLLTTDPQLQPERVELARFAQEAAELQRAAANAYGVQLRLRIDPALGAAETDPVRLRQIVANLVSNALKYREPGQPDPWIELTFEASGPERWRVAVEDNGVGIAPEDQERIFEEFQRVGNARHAISGAGLGLTITRRLVERLGGEIRVRSEPGRGSRFEVDLPLGFVPAKQA
jgi:signal transduction histidine kinase